MYIDMNFGQALQELKLGKSVTRKGWNAKGLFIRLQIPDEHSKMTKPYIYMTSPAGSTNHYGANAGENRVPWLPSCTDILADDWYIVQ